MERERYAKAREYFDKCWEIASRGVGFASRMAMVKAALAELALHTGAIEEAQSHVVEAMRLAKEAGVRPELAYATLVRGMIASRKHEWAHAVEYLDHASKMFDELEDKHSLGRVNAALANMHIARDQEQDRERAQKYIGIAQEMFSALGAQSDLAKLPQL